MMTTLVVKRDGSTQEFDATKIEKAINWAVEGLDVSADAIKDGTVMLVRPNMPTAEIQKALILSASKLIKRNCMDASLAAARLMLLDLYSSVAKEFGNKANTAQYPTLRQYIERAVAEKALTPELLEFDLEALNAVIKPENDKKFEYLGLTILVDRYLTRSQLHVTVKESGAIIELPQHFFMRVAMGLALGEAKADRLERAIEFYELFSSHDYLSSTPTLFNSGTNHPQLSSCYLNTVADSLSSEDDENRYASIYGTIDECARLSKYAGGIGTDWTRVRSSGDLIKGTQGKSSGIVPYLKVYNDTAVAVNQGGKRKGSFAPYLELWHTDVWQFCELKKNSGDERLRAHDIYPAMWACDLFMERVKENGIWSFFSPAEYPELHELFGDAFKVRYEQLEAEGKYRSQMPAKQLWKKWLTSLFETGHPWVTFKDECNRRNPQQHAGVIHSSNLCTEITLNTSDDETAVCNLGSINLSQVESPEQLRKIIRTAVRMLDNVIDINFYPSSRARNGNLRHRPIGLGVMGYAEYLIKRGIAFDSEEHLVEADKLFEMISYYAIEASSDLAAERGKYQSYEGSLWSQGILPLDTARKGIGYGTRLDWDALRTKVLKQGMRNSNVMAIAPTATISNILGTTPCIEPPYELECVKSNLSGPFDWIDPSLRYVEHAHLVKSAFDIDQAWIIRAAAVRQRWIDQAQSINLFAKLGTKGKDLASWYMLAWELGLKTTYYLRNESNTAQAQVKSKPVVVDSPANAPHDVMEQEMGMCSIDNPDCEACQ
ncbi:ribonucleoside-diphosphate reductase subunit alpha [Acinetobacter baumannii]